jgi:hypothetical protein
MTLRRDDALSFPLVGGCHFAVPLGRIVCIFPSVLSAKKTALDDIIK